MSLSKGVKGKGKGKGTDDADDIDLKLFNLQEDLALWEDDEEIKEELQQQEFYDSLKKSLCSGKPADFVSGFQIGFAAAAATINSGEDVDKDDPLDRPLVNRQHKEGIEVGYRAAAMNYQKRKIDQYPLSSASS